jgi:hypothetical protein
MCARKRRFGSAAWRDHYDAIRRIARGLLLSWDRSRIRLGSGSLAHAGWFRFNQQRNREFANTAHFLGSVRAMLGRALLDHWDYIDAEKRKGDLDVSAERPAIAALVTSRPLPDSRTNDSLLDALDEAFKALKSVDPHLARLLKLSAEVKDVSKVAKMSSLEVDVVSNQLTLAKAFMVDSITTALRRT